MKKILYYLLILLSLVCLICSCDMEDAVSESRATEQTEEEEDPETYNRRRKIKDEEWNDDKSAYLAFTTSNKKEIFYIEDVEMSQSISVTYRDLAGNDSLATVEWTHNLPDNATVVFNETSFSFNVNSINELGDYYVTANASDSKAKKTYVFSYVSRLPFESALSYSFINYAEMKEKGLLLEDGTYELGLTAETDGTGKKIESQDDRAVVGDKIEYLANGNTVLLLSLRDGYTLGNLSFEVEEEYDEYVPIISKTTENQILVFAGEKKGDFTITVKAGNKLAKEIEINSDTKTHTAPKCVVAGPFDSVYGNGKIYSVTGDSVATTSEEDGNRLYIQVLRKGIFASDDDPYEVYDYEDNPETSVIPNGKKIHLTHAGKYQITSYLIERGGFTSEPIVSEFEIQPYIYDGAINVSWHTENGGNISWNTFSEGQIPRSNYYTVRVTNGSAYTMTLYKNVAFTDTNVPEELYIDRDADEPYRTLSPGTYIEENLQYAGNYEYYYSVDAPGYGYIHEYEITDEHRQTITLNPDSFRDRENLISCEVSTTEESSYEVSSIAGNIPSNAELWIALYRNGVYKEQRIWDGSVWVVNNYDGDSITFKSYIHYETEHTNSPVYTLEPAANTITGKAKIDSSDAVQRYRNKRTAKITLSRDEFGNIRPTYYSLDNKQTWTRIYPNSNGIYYFEPLTQAGVMTLWVKTEPTQEEGDLGFTLTSAVIRLSQLSKPAYSAKKDTSSSYLAIYVNYTLSTVPLYSWLNLGSAPTAYMSITPKTSYGSLYESFGTREITTSYIKTGTAEYKISYIGAEKSGFAYLLRQLANYISFDVSVYQYKVGYIDSPVTTTTI